jgi:Ice-binding-like/IPTL-CTERM motif
MNAQTASVTRSKHVAPRVAEANSRFSRNYQGLLASAGFVALLSLVQVDPAWAATAPNLGSTSTYGVVSGTFTNSNTAPQTIINGTASQPVLCYTTLSTGLPVTITGTVVVPCPPLTVGVDQGLALANLNAQANAPSCTVLSATPLEAVVIGVNPAGTFPPGCYTSAGAMNITANGIVTLSGAGVYVFRPGGALNTGANSSVILAGGACASDVFWGPVGATNLGANSGPSFITPTFQGNILDAAGINIGHFANLTGRALAFGGTVLTDANTITVPTCAPFGGGNTAIPTLSEWAMVMLAGLLAIAGFAAMRRQTR